MLFVVLLSISSVVVAQEPAVEKPSDVRIIVDISGSMKKNDPENLRLPAVNMLAKLLPDGGKSGIWTFGQFINMLVKHREVDENWKKDATNKASGINSVGQYTNIGEALEKAAYDKDYPSSRQYQTHVILLTDGMVDIDRDPAVNERERSRIINEVLPAYKKAGFIIHTVSLSDNADKKLMDKLALATGGQSVVAKTADELMEIFLNIFNRAVPQEELPFEGNSFLTDSSIEEFTALIFREPNSPETTLFSPDKSVYTKDTKDSNVKWFRTDKYDLITVKQPLEGEWRVLADLEPKSRITVVSDLSLSVKSIPPNLMINDVVDLSLAFREEEKIVDRVEFLGLLDIHVSVNTINTDSGGKVTWSKHLSTDLIPRDGVYNTLLKRFDKVGEYEIIVDVDGLTFQRRSVQRVNVRTPFKVETKTVNDGENTQFIIEVIPQSQSVNLANTKVVAKLKPPEGSTSIEAFTLTDDQVWTLAVKPKTEGVYRVTIRITTTNVNGDTNDIIPDLLTFTYPVVDEFFKENVASAEKAPLVEVPESVVVIEEPIVIAEEAIAAEKIESKEPEKDSESMMKWLLYGAIGLINLFIIGVIYFLYRKFIKSKKDESEVIEEKISDKKPEASPAMGELPMDEMAIDEIESDIDLAENDSVEQAVGTSEVLADLAPESLDDDLSDDLDKAFDDSEIEEPLAEVEEPLAEPSAEIEEPLAEVEEPVESIADDQVELGDDTLDDSTGSDLEDMVNLGENLTDETDEDPEFDLDDFAPDQLDGDGTSEKKE